MVDSVQFKKKVVPKILSASLKTLVQKHNCWCDMCFLKIHVLDAAKAAGTLTFATPIQTEKSTLPFLLDRIIVTCANQKLLESSTLQQLTCPHTGVNHVHTHVACITPPWKHRNYSQSSKTPPSSSSPFTTTRPCPLPRNVALLYSCCPS